jgi:hypothetical protein
MVIKQDFSYIAQVLTSSLMARIGVESGVPLNTPLHTAKLMTEAYIPTLWAIPSV